MDTIIFDFDGIIIDTESTELLSYQELYARFGAEFPLQPWLQAAGRTLTFDPYEYLQSAAKTDLDYDALRRWRRRRHWELSEQEPVREGIRDYLQRAVELGLNLAVASNSKADWVVSLLEKERLKKYFDVIVTGDRIAWRKPSPTLYRMALDSLGADCREAFAIEDSINGLMAAKAAGLACVVVPNPITVQLPWPYGMADLRLDSFTEMRLDDVLTALSWSPPDR